MSLAIHPPIAHQPQTGDLNLAEAPTLSVILVTPDGLACLRRTLAHLRAQTIAPRLELLIVAPAETAESGSDALGAGPSPLQMRCVPLAAIRSIAQANAAGVRAARAPIVAFVEEHSFPDAGWAAALVDAYTEDCAAVGPVVRNANPWSRTSQADYLIAYGRWGEGAPSGPADFLPGHNGSYRRDLLLAYGEALEAMLEAESVLHWDLRAAGWQLRLEPRARVAHLNFEHLRAWTAAQYHSGRVFAAARSVAWRLPRRLLYAAASPLIPAVRLARLLRQPAPHPLALLPALLWGLGVSALGELAGYLTGAGASTARVGILEFHRWRHVSARTRALLGEPSA